MSGTSYPKGAKAWYSNAEYVSTIDNNTNTPGDSSNTWIKLNDLSGTSGGGSTVTCGWDATKIGNIISSLSSLSSSITEIQTDIDNLQTDITTIDTKITNLGSTRDVLLDEESYSYVTMSLNNITTGGAWVSTDTLTGNVPDAVSAAGWYKIIGYDNSDIEEIIIYRTKGTSGTSVDPITISKMSLPTPWIHVTGTIVGRQVCVVLTNTVTVSTTKKLELMYPKAT